MNTQCLLQNQRQIHRHRCEQPGAAEHVLEALGVVRPEGLRGLGEQFGLLGQLADRLTRGLQLLEPLVLSVM